jgi:hypothetical protein
MYLIFKSTGALHTIVNCWLIQLTKKNGEEYLDDHAAKLF